MNTINLNPLKLLVRQAAGDLDELAKIARTETECNATIDKILEDGRVDEVKEQQLLMQSRLRLDLIPARRKKLLGDQPKIIREMRAELEARRHDYNKAVRRRADEVRAEVIAALAPFYPEAKRQLSKDVGRLQIPAVAGVRGAADNSFIGNDAKPEQFIDLARAFVDRVHAHAKSLGIQLTES